MISNPSDGAPTTPRPRRQAAPPFFLGRVVRLIDTSDSALELAITLDGQQDVTGYSVAEATRLRDGLPAGADRDELSDALMLCTTWSP